MSYGFVYLLANPAMRGFYKIGCTERAPHQRVSELSGSTAVPMPFDLICYIEVDGYRDCETELHQQLSDFRVNGSREFFGFHAGCKPWLHGLFKHHPNALAFTEVELSVLSHSGEALNPWDGRNTDDGPDMPDFAPLRLHEINQLG